MIKNKVKKRFWKNVAITPSCWLWTATITDGYGRIQINKKKMYAHRLAYELLIGIIPNGLELDHLCRVRNCVNPNHLEPVTHKENLQRGIHSNGQINKTCCKHGHEYTNKNTYKYPDGRRDCRICQKIRTTKYRKLKNTNKE